MKKLIRRLLLIISVPIVIFPLLLFVLFFRTLGGLIEGIIEIIIDMKDLLVDLYLTHWLRAWK